MHIFSKLKALLCTLLAIVAAGFFLTGCLSEQELAERARQAELNDFKIELCADEPSRWKPALKKLFTLVEQGNSEGIKIFLSLTDLMCDNDTKKYFSSPKDEELHRVEGNPRYVHRSAQNTRYLKVTGKRYKRQHNNGYDYYDNEWAAFVAIDCAVEIQDKCFELARKNVPFATRTVANWADDEMFRYWFEGYGREGYCIKTRFWTDWGMWLIDNKSEGALGIAFDFAWYVGNTKFSNRKISSGWGDSDGEGFSNIESYAEKFFTEYAEKGDAKALSHLFWALTTEPEVGTWKYCSRAIKTLENLSISGNKEAINYLIRIMNKDSAQKHESDRNEINHFAALKALIEIQKKKPSSVIHEAIMEIKNKTKDTDVYDYIEKNYRYFEKELAK